MAIADTELKQRIVKLLREDEEFRYTLIGMLATAFIRRDEILEILKEIRNLRLDFNERVIKLEERMEELRRDFNERIIKLEERVTKLEERFIKLEERMEELRRDFNERIIKLEERVTKLEERFIKLEERMERGFSLLGKRIDALGTKWGLRSEETFRRGLKELLEEKFNVKVERWEYLDADGYALGYPTKVEVDVAIRDKEHILIEIKASTSSGDLWKLKRIGELYERVIGVKPELWVITAYTEKGVRRAAREFGIKVVSIDKLYE